MIFAIGLLLSTFQSAAPPNAGGAETPEPLYCTLAVSNDGRLVAAGDAKGRVQLFDGALQPLIELPMGFRGGPWKLEFAPSGRQLAGLGVGGELVIWSFRKGQRKLGATLFGPITAVELESIASGPVGRYSAVMRWSPSGKHLGIATRTGAHSLWTADGTCLGRWNVSADSLRRIPTLRWSAAGERVYSSSGSAIEIRSGETGVLSSKLGGRIDSGSHVVSFDINPEDNLLATGHTQGELRIWDLSTGEQVDSQRFADPIFPEPEDKICDLAFAPDGSTLALAINKGSVVFVYDLLRKQTTYTSGFLGAHFWEPMPIAWDPSGKTLWYSFECAGAVASQVKLASGITQKCELGDLPRFGGRVGVQLALGKLQLVAP